MKVECPRCKTQVEAAAGQNLSCPTCGFSAEVPQSAPTPASNPPSTPTDGSWTSTGGAVIHEVQQAPRTGMAIAALVTGIIGFLTGVIMIGLVLDVVAIVLGIVVLVQAKNRPAEVGGKGMAIAAIVVGAVGLLVMTLLLTVGVQLAVEACREDPDQPNCDEILDTYGARQGDGPLHVLGAMAAPLGEGWLNPGRASPSG